VAVDSSATVAKNRIQRRAGAIVEFLALGHRQEALPWRNKSTRVIGGTSFSAPVATGLMARILSIHPDIHPDQMKMALREIAEPEIR
jgi:hypothetical protein